MPKDLLESMRTTARIIGHLMNLPDEQTEISMRDTPDGQCFALHDAIKTVAEKHDVQKVLSFKKDSDSWMLIVNDMHTEKYHLIGVLANACSAIVGPYLDKIRSSLSETVSKINEATHLNMELTPSYIPQEKMFCINITTKNDVQPLKLCHQDIDYLIVVAKNGIPNIVKMMSGKRKKRRKVQ